MSSETTLSAGPDSFRIFTGGCRFCEGTYHLTRIESQLHQLLTLQLLQRPTSCASTTARHSRPGVLAFSHQCVVQQHIFASFRSLYSAVPSRIVPAPVGYRYVNLVTCRGSCFQAARRILEQLGVELHPQKTRMVQVRCGFEFLGYKIKLGYRKRHLPGSKIRSQANR